MKKLRRHLSYANVIATFALLFAMSGGALAANQYLLTSTKQISPSVVKKLKGRTGAQGKTGATGAAGAPGATGATGPQGSKGTDGTNGTNGTNGVNGKDGFSALSTLPSGASESGDFGLYTANTSGFLVTADSFPIPLAATIPASNVVYDESNTVGVTHCSGPGHADPGFLCLYKDFSTGVKDPPTIRNFEHGDVEGAGNYGFFIEWDATGSPTAGLGTWTVTAP
jgi:hypothetical protein